MNKLRIEDVTLQFAPKGHQGITALDRISLDVADKEFAVIVGPSGCGKSSLLRLVAGLGTPTTGHIYLDGSEVIAPGRERGMVFQSYALYPHMTVKKNIAFPLKMAKMPEDVGLN